MVGKVVARATVVVTSVLFVFLLAPGLVAASSAALTITKPVTGESVASSTPSFAGTTTDTLDSITVSIYAGPTAGGTPVQTLSVLSPVAESWEVAAESSLVDREYTVVAEQAGETSAAVTFTVDVPPPVVTVNPVATWTKDSTPTLEGSAGDSTSVEVTVEGPSPTKGAAVLSGGNWSYTPASPLVDGAYTARAVGKDSAGNIGESSTVTFTVDTVAPSVTLESVASPSNDTTPTLKGSAGVAAGDDASVEVAIYKGSVASGTPARSETVVPNGGSWTYTPAPPLAEGTYTAQAVQEDKAGNVGKSTPVTFTVDTTPPVLTVNPVAAWTKDSTPALGGSAGDSASVEVILEGPSASKGAAVLSGGNWSYTPGSALPDGTYTARAVGKDLAGNVGESSSVTFTVDTVAPAVTLESVASPSNDTTPMLKGSAGVAAGDDASVEVAIYKGSVASGTPARSETVAPSGGSWTYTPAPPLTEGTYTAQAVQEDKAGNVGKSTAITFVVVTAKPVVTIQSIASPTRATEPALSGSAGDSASVEVRVFEGSSPSGTVASSGAAVLSGGSWSYTPTSALADGTYTAQASGLDKIDNEGKSSAITFTVDTTPPALTLTSPTNNALLEVARPTFSGQAGTATGDRPSVRLTIYSGASASGSPVQTLEIASSGSSWTSGSNGPTLADGIYTVVAEQLDEASNVSRASATFAVEVPTPPAPPVASFQWFPAAPHVGEQVSLVSTSSDAGSPITAFSWALAPGLALTPGEHVLTTTFSTPGSHVVRLRVVDANGLASEVAETIPVSAPEVPLMQPFPVVRIAGSAKTSSVKISLFTVLAPVGAKVSVSCHGHGCPTKRQSFVVAARRRSHGGTMLVSLTRFERSLDVGAVIEVRISKAGEIGKYTRFTVRRGKLPTRLDGCLSTSSTPMTCPST